MEVAFTGASLRVPFSNSAALVSGGPRNAITTDVAETNTCPCAGSVISQPPLSRVVGAGRDGTLTLDDAMRGFLLTAASEDDRGMLGVSMRCAPGEGRSE